MTPNTTSVLPAPVLLNNSDFARCSCNECARLLRVRFPSLLGSYTIVYVLTLPPLSTVPHLKDFDSLNAFLHEGRVLGQTQLQCRSPRWFELLFDFNPPHAAVRAVEKIRSEPKFQGKDSPLFSFHETSLYPLLCAHFLVLVSLTSCRVAEGQPHWWFSFLRMAIVFVCLLSRSLA